LLFRNRGNKGDDPFLTGYFFIAIRFSRPLLLLFLITRSDTGLSNLSIVARIVVFFVTDGIFADRGPIDGFPDIYPDGAV